MGTGSGKPLRWMLRLSRHTGREHHSRRGERRKCLMFNQDSVPCPSHSLSPVLPRPHPLWRGSRRQEVLHLAPTRGKAAGGGGRRRTRARCGNLFLTTRSSAATPGLPPPSRHTTWAGGRTAPRSPLYLVIFPLSLGGRLLPPPRMGRLLQNKSFITVSAL